MAHDYKDPLYEIIRGCAKGDRKCQQLIYEKFYGKMLGVCMRYSTNTEEAKDVLQDGFIKVFSNIKKYGSSGSFEGWLRKVIVNTAIDHIRKNKKLLKQTDPDSLQNIAEQTNDDEDTPQWLNFSSQEIMQAVQQLSPAYRTVFNMFMMEEFTHKEIARKLRISEGTSKANFSKAKRNLRKILLRSKSQAQRVKPLRKESFGQESNTKTNS